MPIAQDPVRQLAEQHEDEDAEQRRHGGGDDQLGRAQVLGVVVDESADADGATAEEERELEAELLADPKERAEPIMLVDLGRNDVGRVAATGTVKVTENMAIERYSHVMHIVSNVEGTLKPGLDAFSVLRASFPAGTLSGAPKVRAMEIIDELEPTRRGIYGGAVGYLGFHGDMDMAIAIRTAILKDGMLHVQAGAGIVADSDPASEWRETQNKARAVLRAAEIALGGLDSTVPGAAPR